MRLGRRTLRRIVVVTMDRHGLRRPKLMQFLLLLFFITLDGKYDGPSYSQRSNEGLRSKILQLLDCCAYNGPSHLPSRGMKKAAEGLHQVWDDGVHDGPS